MNFDFSDEQKQLREELRRFMGKEVTPALARAAMDDPQAGQAAWQALGELGAGTMMLPEDCGGQGLGALELCVLAEEAGRVLAPLPWLPTLGLAAQALLIGADAATRQAWLPRIAAGEAATLAAPLDGQTGTLPRFDGQRLSGESPLVPGGMEAAFAVVLARDDAGHACLVVCELDATVTRGALPVHDAVLPCAHLAFSGTVATRLACDASATLQRVRERAAVFVAFAQLGAADGALAMAAAYARERRAFGRPIGAYQGIKHKLADVYTRNEMARVHCYYAAWALSADAPELGRAAAAARIAATDALTFAAQENIQTHGGMGYTWEMDCHLYYRHARASAVLLGGRHLWSEALVRALEQEAGE